MLDCVLLTLTINPLPLPLLTPYHGWCPALPSSEPQNTLTLTVTLTLGLTLTLTANISTLTLC
jgi:hypothetical protein